MTNLSIKLQDTWALLIGVGKFAEEDEKKLPPIPAVTNNLAKLRELLVNPAIIGIPPEQIIVIGDKEVPKDNSDILGQIKKLPFPVETLFVYYVGHGISYNGPDESCKKLLYLAHFKTPHDSSSLALPFVDLWNETFVRATNLIYILDCCQSGKALNTIRKQVGKNISVLTATLPTVNAKAPEGEKHSSFSKHLIELLEKGFGEVPALSTIEIRKELGKRLLSEGFPKPWGEDFLDTEEALRIANNRAFSQTGEKSSPRRNSLSKLDEMKLLSYLADRFDHRLELEKAIRRHHNKQRPLLCLIHGEECQRDDKFIESLVWESPKKYLGAKLGGSKQLSVKSDIFKNINKLHENIRAGLRDRLSLGEGEASDDEIVSAIAQYSSVGPVIFEIIMYTDDWRDAGRVEIVKGFASFWANLPPLPPTSNHLVLVCLRFQYQSELTKPGLFEHFRFFFWNKPPINEEINEEIKATFANLEFASGEVHGVVLPELCSIRKKHVVEWVNSEVTELFHDKVDEIMLKVHNLFESHPTMTMAELGPRLYEILKQCCYQ